MPAQNSNHNILMAVFFYITMVTECFTMHHIGWGGNRDVCVKRYVVKTMVINLVHSQLLLKKM